MTTIVLGRVTLSEDIVMEPDVNMFQNELECLVDARMGLAENLP